MKLENFTQKVSNGISKIAGTLAILLITVFSNQIAAQDCPVACNNRVQVSMDADCNVTITPEMILEGENILDCDYSVAVLGPNDIPIPSSPDVNENYIGRTLKVKVTLNDTGNSCWGYIVVEDKQPPIITCFQEPEFVSCYSTQNFIPPTATDNCDGPVLVDVVSDVIEDLDCSDEYSAVRTIMYQATDKSGNKSAICMRTIFYERITLDDIVFPESYDDISNPHFEACELGTFRGNPVLWDLDDDGYPDPWVDVNNNGKLDYPEELEGGVPTTIGMPGFPIFPNTSYCEINATFHDKVIDICEKSFKVLRTWTILNWCTSEIRDTFQILKVLDTQPPVLTAIPETTIEAEPYNCEADWVVPHPVEVDAFKCTSFTYTVDYLLADNNGEPPVNGLYIDDNVVEIKNNGVFSHYVIEDLPLGRTWVRWTVTDDCGNVTRIRSEVTVVDKIPPIPVCDEFTVVTLTTSGYAKIFAETFDDGSHDNCTEVGFEVRRMGADVCDDDNDNDVVEEDDWGPYVKFCCVDATGEDIMVQLRVWDDADGDGIFGSEGDNSNTCMVVVHVQDKIDPVIVCPPNFLVDCGYDLWDLSIFGTVREDKEDREYIERLPWFLDWTGELIDGYAADNCSVTVSEDSEFFLDQCNVGEVLRTFTATDGNGRTSECTQIIEVINRYPFDGLDEPNYNDTLEVNEWPEDYYTDEACIDIDTDPENLPDPYGYPDLDDDQCSQLAITYEDQVFSFVDGVCFKILRKWTVIDWCQFDPVDQGPDRLNGNGYEGYWHWIQIIKINNSIDPIIDNTSNITRCIYGPGCEGFIDLTNSAADDCTPEGELRWTFEIDLFNDDSVDSIGFSNDASDVYPIGIHEIKWTVEDHCGNETIARHLFNVLDCKNPTPYCISEITTVIMPSSGTVEIWAKDFDHGSNDNCTPQDSLFFTFGDTYPVPTKLDEEHFFKGIGETATLAEYLEGNAQKWIPGHYNDYREWCPGTSGQLFRCEEAGMHELEMYVHDEFRNKDFCLVTINIQANEECDGQEGGLLVSGQVLTSSSQSVENVMVSLEDMTSNSMSYFQTEKDGNYGFNEMPLNRDYTLAAERDDDFTNGVSTLDIVLIQRHILGIQSLDDPYKVIAADINNSSSVSASDIIQLRKLILGIYNELPDNKSWRFVDATQDFYEIDQPWDFQETILLKDIVAPNNNNNFIGVKIGDVNGSAIANARSVNTSTRSDIATRFIIKDVSFKDGEMVRMEFTSEDFIDILGYQMTLDISNALEYIDIESGALDISSENLGLTQSSEGLISMSWNDTDAVGINSGEVLFTMTFRAKTNGTISDNVKITSDLTNAEAYNSDLAVAPLRLEYSSIQSTQIVLNQNRPNPFSESTIISFTLPEEANATLSVYDISGRLLKKVSQLFPAGTNNVELRAEELNASGVLYYQLESGAYKTTKKMILIDK